MGCARVRGSCKGRGSRAEAKSSCPRKPEFKLQDDQAWRATAESGSWLQSLGFGNFHLCLQTPLASLPSTAAEPAGALLLHGPPTQGLCSCQLSPWSPLSTGTHFIWVLAQVSSQRESLTPQLLSMPYSFFYFTALVPQKYIPQEGYLCI